MSGSVFGWVCSQQRVQKHRSTSLIHFNEQLKGKQNSQNETFPDCHSSLEDVVSVLIPMCNINTVDIIKLHATTTSNYAFPLALCWYCVYSAKSSPKTCICAFTVRLSVARKHVCMSVCQSVFIYVCFCVDRESGWLQPTAWQLYANAWHRHYHSAGPSLRYIPRRAVLYCPGNDERKLRKLASLDVDCAVLDCEDGVALSKKVQNAQIHMRK